MSLIARLFGAKTPARPPREILAEAIADVGDASLVAPALSWFDSPQDLITRWDEEQGEPPSWADSARPESAAELAYQVFEHVLRENGRVGYLDWADGWMRVVEEFDKMFARAGVAPVSETEQAHMARATQDCKRGATTQILWDYLYELGKKRGLQLHWIHTESDCSYPIFMKPEAWKKWKGARFGKGVDVLP